MYKQTAQFVNASCKISYFAPNYHKNPFMYLNFNVLMQKSYKTESS